MSKNETGNKEIKYLELKIGVNKFDRNLNWNKNLATNQ